MLLLRKISIKKLAQIKSLNNTKHLYHQATNCCRIKFITEHYIKINSRSKNEKQMAFFIDILFTYLNVNHLSSFFLFLFSSFLFIIQALLVVRDSRKQDPEDGPRRGWDSRFIKEIRKMPLFLLRVLSLSGSKRKTSASFLKASQVHSSPLPILGLL